MLTAAKCGGGIKVLDLCQIAKYEIRLRQAWKHALSTVEVGVLEDL
jgi:hypothetical protein